MPADVATLLAEAPWLARLARSLTGDAAEADDIVQETYAAALRSPPDADRPIRPWLRRVAINFARMRHRARARRAANEQVVEVQVEPVRSPDALLERAQLERRLAELVIALDEPFRTTVLLRYREGLTAEQIAKQLGIPAGTVRSRLKTALDRLRRELDDGDRAKLRAAFVPVGAAYSPSAATSTLKGLVMAKLSKTAVALLLLALLIGGGAFVMLRRNSSTKKPAVATTPTKTESSPNAKAATMFVQPGVAARRLRGRVVSDGAGYRGATVRLTHAETDVMIGETTSGTDGAFDLGDRAADVYVVTASAPDRAAMPVSVDLRMPATTEVVLQLAGCSHLRGSVVDGSGAPIDHARIARDEAAVPFAETDASGQYDLCTHFGASNIRYSASGYQSVIVSIQLAESGRRDVVLIPEATVEGKVVTEDGAPVEGAWIVVDPNQMGPTRNARVGGFSERDGTFRIAGVSAGRNTIAAFAAGYRSSHKQEVVTGVGVTSNVVVRLVRSAVVTGTVVAGGKPVAGVGVGIRIGNRDETGVLAVTQADGSFSIDRAPRGDVALYVEHHIVIAPRSVHLEASTNVRIEVQKMGAVRGRVLRDNVPVADAQVTCPGPRPKIFTDSSGTYFCDGVDDGPQELAADLATGAWGYATATVTRGETTTLDIPLTFTARICGRVVDDKNTPVPGIDVIVAEQTSGDYGRDVSASDGTFCALFLTGGTYGVVVQAGPRVIEPLAAIGAVTLGPNETKSLTISVAPPRLSISGTVSDPHGAPVADAIVRIVAANRVGAPNLDPSIPSARVVTDDAGRFTFTKLAAGDYMLVATAGDGSEAISPSIPAGSSNVAITVAAAGRIEGDLVGFKSPPTITGLQITGTHNVVIPEVDGQRFRANGLSPGTYVLTALTDAHESDIEQIVVRAGETARLTLTNRGTATVTGVVRDFKTRAPLPGARCSAFPRDGDVIGVVFAGPDEAVLADARGTFRLTSPAGEINLICFVGPSSAERAIVAPANTTTSSDVFVVARTQVPGTIDAEFEFMSRRIRELVKGGAADRAGIAIGDDVVAVDGVSIADLGGRAAMLLITQRPTGAIAKLTILRGTEKRTVAVTVGAPN